LVNVQAIAQRAVCSRAPALHVASHQHNTREVLAQRHGSHQGQRRRAWRRGCVSSGPNPKLTRAVSAPTPQGKVSHACTRMPLARVDIYRPRENRSDGRHQFVCPRTIAKLATTIVSPADDAPRCGHHANMVEMPSENGHVCDNIRRWEREKVRRAADSQHAVLISTPTANAAIRRQNARERTASRHPNNVILHK
jgi:hypothetical protein